MASFSKYSTARGTRWRVSWRDDGGAQRTKRGFETKGSAKAWWERRSMVSRLPASTTVEEAWQRAAASADWRPSTHAAMERTWRLHVAPRWARVQVQEVRGTDVEAWLGELADSMSRASVTRARAVLSKAMEWSVRAGILSSSPVTAVRTPRRDRPTIGPRSRDAATGDGDGLRVPSAVAVDAIAAVVEDSAPEAGPVRAAMIRLLASTGMRWGEAAALRFSDVDLTASRARISRTASVIDGEITVGPPKGGTARIIALPRAAVAVVEERADAPHAPDSLIFPSLSGQPQRSPGRAGWWKAAVREVAAAGIEVPATLTPHDLRHHAATNFLRAGLPITAVARQLGHSSPRVTLDVYAGVTGDDLGAIADM